MKPSTLQGLFEAQAIQTPDAVALIEPGRSLSFRELDHLSGQLAAQLVQQGVMPLDFVPITLAKSVDAVVAILAVLKVGAAYVPLSQRFPEQFTRSILDDIQAKVCVGEVAAPLTVLQPPRQATSTHLPKMSSAGAENPIAWVLYTSGSTGKPKGVLGTHSACLARCDALLKHQPLVANDVCVAYTALTVVDSFWEIFGPLSVGAPVLVLAEPQALDFMGQVQLLQQHSVTRICLVPSMLRVFIDNCSQLTELLPKLRTWIVSGEPLDRKLVRQFYASCPDATLFNQYGLTESCADATSYNTRDLINDPGDGMVPVGQVFDHSSLHIVNPDLEEVAPGEEGQVCLGGACVAAGYLNAPQASAERFRHLTNLSDGPVLLTGDLGRIDEQGQLLVSGRMDRQVKVRGFRVSLDQIEDTLNSLPDVAQSLVVTQTEKGRLQVVAYVVAAQPGLDIEQLIRALESTLPDYMRPEGFVLLDRMPTTHSGKPDRKSLPLWKPQASTPQGVRDVQRKNGGLQGVWCESLKLESCGSQLDFFALGGDSLELLRMTATLQSRWQKRLDMSRFLTNPTFATLSHLLDSALSLELCGTAVSEHREDTATPGQRQIWLHDQSLDNATAYVITVGCRLIGEFSLNAFSQAMNTLVERHPALRANLVLEGSSIVQQLRSATESKVYEQDLEGDAGLNSPALQHTPEAVVEFITKGIDIQHDAPVQALVFNEADDRHLVVIKAHHAIIDGPGLDVVLKELSTLYGNALRQQPVATATYSTEQYFARCKELDTALINPDEQAFWIDRLRGSRPSLLIEPDVVMFNGTETCGALDLTWSGEKLAAIQDAATRLSSTPYALFLTAYALTLAAYAPSQDTAYISVPVSRRQDSAANMPGCFIETIPCPIPLFRSGTLEEAHKRSLEALKQSLAHMSVPFQKIVESAAASKHAIAPNTFQTLLALDTEHESQLQFEGASSSPLLLEGASAKYPLSADIYTAHDRWRMRFEYDRRHYTDEFAESIAAHFRSVLDHLVQHAEADVSRVLNAHPANTGRQPVSLHGQECPAQIHTIAQRIAQIAKDNQDRVAIRSADGELSYGLLEVLSDRVADGLIKKGVHIGQTVSVALERDRWFIVGLLGIHKAGAAYSPLPENAPSNRLHNLIKAAAPALILSSGKRHQQLLQEQGIPEVVDVVTLCNSEAHAPGIRPSMGAAAYVLFTSGTTGAPKGVAVSHLALANLVTSFAQELSVTRQDVVLAITPLTFDIAGLEIWLPLSEGALVVLLGEGAPGDPQQLAHVIRTQGISIMQATPATWLMLVGDGWSGAPSLRALCGGEALSIELARQLYARVIQLRNVYGPTETTIWSTCLLIQEHHLEGTVLPLGQPIQNTSLHVVDARGEPCQRGVPGELWIGGQGVALGYVGQKELTAQKFVSNPLLDPTLLYRTGDLVRWRVNGDLEFLGRMDDQVKLRGFRIELGEIAHALRQHDGVTDALVLADTQAGEARLVAYVMPAHRAHDSAGLRESLRRELPEYMVPTAFVGVDQWPLTQNGKIDRRALPQPQAATGGNGAIPTEGLPHQLAQAWSEVLEVQHLSVEDNFFDLGGHSLLAMRLISRLRNDGLEINLRQFFDRPTIARQAEFFAQQPRDPLITAVEIPRLPREEFLPLSMTQNRLWILDQLVPGNPVYNIPLALRLTGPLQQGALVKALEAIVQRHEILRANFINDDGEPQIILRTSAALPFEDVELSADNLDELLTERARRPFDLSEDALIRATLVTLEAEHHVLLLVIHHIVFDGWSQSVLLKELAQLYSDFCNARPSSLPELAYQYIDYAQWKRTQLAEQGVLERQQRFWREKIGSAPKTFGLPTDFPRPAVQSFAGAEYVFDLAQPLMRDLESLARQQRITLFSLMLSAFAATLAQLSGHQEVVIGTDLAGRKVSGSDSLVGFFVNNVPLRFEVAPDLSWQQLVSHVHDQFMEVIDQPVDLEFDQIVDAVRPKRETNRNLLFQTLFALHHETDEMLHWHNLTVDRLDFDSATSPFDLSLHVTRRGERFVGLCRYSTSLYLGLSIEMLCTSFTTLLELWSTSLNSRCEASPRNSE
ncbi:non-ribosomal peptide synthetase [Pseudomonas helleri]|uniref:non-ribosomal peptide synthetase n=1 Tax=Pseudomonas helleri TaxID=1608996 RepID=UPI00242F614A|nr:non-ribosomal peptide synthetase [Pseudomonas helleri]